MPVKFGNKCKNSENITGKINTKYKNARKKVKYWKSCRGGSAKKGYRRANARQRHLHKNLLLTKHYIRYTIVNNKCVPDERMITYGKNSLVKCRMGDYEYPLEISRSDDNTDCSGVK